LVAEFSEKLEGIEQYEQTCCLGIPLHKSKEQLYSQLKKAKEEGTKAHFTGKQIPLKVIHERLDRLLLLQQDITFKKNKKKVGKTFKVLVEGKSKEKKGYYVGRSQYQAPEVDGVIFIKGKNLRTGDFVCVKITKAQEYDLIGKAIK